jgi:hypothetical protein
VQERVQRSLSARPLRFPRANLPEKLFVPDFDVAGNAIGPRGK